MDLLLDRQLTCVTVVDISAAALARSRDRLGSRAAAVQWIEADVTGEWPAPAVDIWHDRAVFHFLTGALERERYRAHLGRALRPGGSAIIATFAPEGPDRCSGLPVRRYDPQMLQSELGSAFQLVESMREAHQTPAGTTQEFWFSRFVVG